MLGSRRSIGDRLRTLEEERRPRLNFTEEVMACISDDDAEWMVEQPLHPRTKRLDTVRMGPAATARFEAILNRAFEAAGVPMYL